MNTLRFSLCLIGILVGAYTKAGTFTSNASTAWNLPATWTFSGDADGIPDSDDDVTILAAHTVSVSGTSNNCRDLTVSGVINLNSGCNVKINRNYQLNGSETGVNGSISMWGTTGTISGTGTFGTQVRVTFISGGNFTISSEVQFLKSIVCNTGNCTITNNGYVRFNRVYGAAGGTWINATGSTLELNSSLITEWLINLNCSATNNTVFYSNSSGSIVMKTPVGGVYHHLTISGSGSSKRLASNIQINGNLTFGANGILDSDGFDIGLAGNFVKPLFTGVIVQDPGTQITFNGTSAQSLNSTGAHSFLDLIFDNPTTVTFNTGTFNIQNSFTVLQGTVNVGTNRVTLHSTAAQTAIIGPSSGTISGSLTLERFISGRTAGYSDMSSPLTNGTFAQLDDDMIIAYVYNPPSAYPTAWSYNESIFDYIPVTDVNTDMFQGVGYEVYLDSDGSQTTWADGTLDFIGTPTMGSVDISGNLSFDNDGWNLVGNPYHANLSWDLFQGDHADVDPTFMFYDEGIEDFATATTGSGELLAPGQGFWINVTSGSPTVVFSENHKSNSTSSTFRNQSQKLFAVRLKSVGGTKFTSATEYRFDTDYRELPFKKIAHPDAPQLYSLNEKNGLRIKNLNSQENTIVIPLGCAAGLDGIYTISTENLNELLALGFTKVEVKDNLKHTITEITNDSYQFYAEKGKDESRFELILTKGSETANLAISNNAIDINRTENNVRINFQLSENKDVNVSILNPLGQQIVPSQTVNVLNEVRYFALPQDYSGIVIVNVTIDGKNISKKLFK